MAQSDDEIPDLFPAAGRPGQAAPRPVRAAPRPARILHPSSPPREVSSAPPAARPSQSPPSSEAVQPPPLRIKDSPSSDGLEIDYDFQDIAPERGTVVVGTPDDALEFDPTSIRRPSAEEYLRGQSPSAQPASTPAASPEIPGLRGEELESGPFELEPSSSIPPAPSISPVSPQATASSQRPSSYPAARQSAAPQASQFPPAPTVPSNLGMNFPGLGGEVELGDGLDDLDFGGAGLAQLNVAIPIREADEVPWPLARTPHPDEIDLDDDEVVALSGFGPAPSGVFSAPMYFLRVFSALNPLKQICRVTQRELRQAELSRDQRLAQVAELNRPQLQQNDRFRSLFSTIERHDQNIIARRQALNAADADGADELRRVQARLEALSGERTVKESRRNEHKRAVEQHQRQMERARAAVRRAEIELRNLEERHRQGVDFGVVDFETRKSAQLKQKAQASELIEAGLDERVQCEKRLEQAEDELRRLVADFQAHEAEKEGLLMAYEGDLTERSRELDEAIWARLNQLAHVARVIFELRGEVKVDAQVRLEIAGADEAVRLAFIDHERARAALASMDVEMYRLGRMMWIGFGVFILLLLIAAAVL